MCVPGEERSHRGEDADDVEHGLRHLQRFHPQRVGGGAAAHAEQTEEQHKSKVGHKTEQQDQHMDPCLQNKPRQEESESESAKEEL